MKVMVQIFFNILSTASLYLLVALSFNFIYSTSKFFNIAQAGIISIAAYFVFWFNQQYHIAIILSVLLSIMLSVVFGAVLDFFLYRPMRKRKVSSLSLLLASIGIYIVIQNSISLFWGDETLRLNIGEIEVSHEVAGAFITEIQILSICISGSLFLTIWLITKYSSFGKAIRAVSDNTELSNIYGINANKVILYVIILGSSLAAIAGIMVAADINMKPTFGFNLLLYGVVAMIIGGLGSYRGLLGGALFVATAQHLAAFYIDIKWMDAIAYLILIVFLIFKPYGFSGNRLKKIEI